MDNNAVAATNVAKSAWDKVKTPIVWMALGYALSKWLDRKKS